MRRTIIFLIGALLIALTLMVFREEKVLNIPEYPNAVEDQEVKAEFLGMDLGGVRRVITSDSFDIVFAYYKAQLRDYNPEIISHTLEDGRQAAFTVIDNDESNLTVAVQEFKKEGVVAISYMHMDMGF
jgi:hypothetical protein